MDGMQPCRVTRWPGPGSQRRSVAASQACKVGAREWAASATIEPRVWDACTPCLACWACWPAGLLACPLWPAGPPIFALLAVSLALGPSPIQQTEYAIGLPYSQPSQSRLQRPSRPHLARFLSLRVPPPVSQQNPLDTPSVVDTDSSNQPTH